MVAFATAAATLAAGCLLAEIGQYEVREIRPHVYLWLAHDVLSEAGDPLFNRAGNSGFVITPQGVVVIDASNSPFNARDILFEIRQRTNLPVRYVIDTSGSPDLTLGNEAFVDFKPTILSTPQAQAALERYRNQLPARLDADWRLERAMRGIHPTVPTATFDGKTSLPGLGVQIQVIDLGSDASPGEAAVVLPQDRVVFIGDVFENAYVPRIGRGNIRHWIETLREVESWDADVYVPAHGPPGTKADVAVFRQFLEWLTNAVAAGIHQGKSAEQIEKEIVPFRNYQWHGPELEREAVYAVYAQLAVAKGGHAPATVSGNH